MFSPFFGWGQSPFPIFVALGTGLKATFLSPG